MAIGTVRLRIATKANIWKWGDNYEKNYLRNPGLTFCCWLFFPAVKAS